MYKDNPGINHKSELSQNIWDLATAIKLAELSGFYEFSLSIRNLMKKQLIRRSIFLLMMGVLAA